MKAKPRPAQPEPAPAPPPTVPVAPQAVRVANPAPVAPSPRPSRRWWLPFVGLLLAGVAGGGIWYFAVRDAVPEPPFPGGITDEEVRTTVEAARSKLLENPRRGAAWGEYGTLLLANLFDKEAVACFLEAEKRDPYDPRWPYARGQVALKRDPENALKLLEAAAGTSKGNSPFRQAFALTLADALLERGEIDRAEALYRDHRAPPDPERAEYGLALVALSRGDRDAATRHFLAAAGHPSCRKQAKSQLAQLARARGEVAAAKQYEADAALLDQDPPWPDPYLDRVVTLQVGTRGMGRRIALLERDGRYQDALNLYEAMAAEKRTSKALTGMGVNLARLGKQDFRQYEAAIERLREATRLDASDSNAHYTLALVLFNKWEKVALADPKAPGLADGFREVVAHAQKTVELKPDHSRALLFWGLALKFLGEPRAALDPLRRGLTVAPENFDLNLTLGQVLAATGDRGGARVSFATAKQLKPNDPRPDDELMKLGQ